MKKLTMEDFDRLGWELLDHLFEKGLNVGEVTLVLEMARANHQGATILDIIEESNKKE